MTSLTEPPTRNKSPLGKILLLLVALLGSAALFVPWKIWIGNRLTTMLESKGFQNVHLTVSTLDLTGISLKDISMGTQKLLRMDNVTIGYAPYELWRGDLRSLTIKGMTLRASRDKEQWTIVGFDSGNGNSQTIIPVEAGDIPLDDIELEDGHIILASSTLNAAIPFQLTVQVKPTPKLTVITKANSFKIGDIDGTVSEGSINATLDESVKAWNGTWEIKGINVKSGDTTFPALDGNGKVTAHADQMVLDGKFKSMDATYKIEFTLDYNFKAPEQSRIALTSAIIPWNSGMLSMQNVVVPLVGKKPVEVEVKAQHVSIDALMKLLAAQQATATGSVSGTLPMTINADHNNISFHQGLLQAEVPGVISMSPDAIPGDNQQVAFLRDVLKNFHYTHLSIAIDTDQQNKSSIMLMAEGANPDMSEGRPVKLNVRLTGAMLDLMRQSVMPFLNPEQLLQQGDNAKN